MNIRLNARNERKSSLRRGKANRNVLHRATFALNYKSSTSCLSAVEVSFHGTLVCV